MSAQKVRFCRQCHELLPPKCFKCLEHPERKPRVVEIFGAPEILTTAPCACVKLRCQRPGCTGTMWRKLKADGTLPLRNHFCTTDCRDAVTAAARTTRRDVPCSYRKCGKVIPKHPSVLARNKDVYCDQRCHYLERQDRKADARRSDENADVQVLCCYSDRCRGAARDHMRTPTGLMACTYCKARRKDDVERVTGIKTPKRDAVPA